MKPRKLPNYLRSSRRRAALTQADIAELLSLQNDATVSRYERRGRLPSLEIALAYEALHGIPVAELFPGAFDEAGLRLRSRARQLGRRLEARAVPAQDRRKRSIEFIASL